MRSRTRTMRAGAILALLLFALVAGNGCGGDEDESEGRPPTESQAAAKNDIPQPGEGTSAVGATLQGKEEPATEKVAPPELKELAKAPTDGSLECARGYLLARTGDRASCETDETSETTAGAQLANNSQSILNGTFKLAKDYADYVIGSSHSDPITYWYLIHPEDCTMVSSDTGRCLIYLWKMTYATGYGAGGVDTGIFREHFLATHVGSNTYQTRIVMIDFIDPYYWECSDTPRANTPRCT